MNFWHFVLESRRIERMARLLAEMAEAVYNSRGGQTFAAGVKNPNFCGALSAPLKPCPPEDIYESARRFSAEMAGGFGYAAQHADQTSRAISSGSPVRSRQRCVAVNLAIRIAISSAFGTENSSGHGLVRCAPRVD
jgi:hypothetical protein